MFEVRPYPSDPSIKIQFDGTSMHDSYPGAVEMGGARVFVDRNTFADPNGNRVELDAAEAGALVLASVAMSNSDINDRLSSWFGTGAKSLASMYSKLGIRGYMRNALAASAAFEKEIYCPDEPPCLSPIKENLRRRFFDLTEGVANGEGRAAISRRLQVTPSAISSSESKIADDLGIGHLARPLAALVFLAGAAEVLPFQMAARQKDLSSLFPEAPTKSLSYNPTEDYTITFRFGGQPMEYETVDVRAGYVEQVRLGGAIVDIENKPFINYEGYLTELQPVELTAVLLKCVLKYDQVNSAVGYNANGYYGPLLRAYCKLVPPAENGHFRKNAILQALRELSKHGIIKGVQNPYLDNLPVNLRQKFQPLIKGIAEERPHAEIAAETGVSEKSIHTFLYAIRSHMRLSTPGLVLASQGFDWMKPLAAQAVA